MDLDRIGIHRSVDAVFPAEVLEMELSELDVPVTIVESAADLEGCSAVVTFSYEEEFPGMVDWIHSIQSGVDRFPFDHLRDTNTILTNSTGIHGDSVGETVTGYLLMFARKLHRHRWNQRDGRWDRPEWDEPFTITGESICVLGLGTLGMGIVERASALGLTVSGVRKSGDPLDGVEPVHPPDRLESAVSSPRFVVSALPLTDETAGMVDATVFGQMRSDAYFINVGRGPVVDEPALISAIETGEIAGAALDVFETEPLPKSSPLWGMESVIVTPHVAAQTRDYYLAIADLIRTNVNRVHDGQPFHNRVV